MKLPKTLYLDLKTWRCGGISNDPKNKNGKGPTHLLNKQGYSCCLGQWIAQADKNIPIQDVSNPAGLFTCKITTIIKYKQNVINTQFTNTCMDINDDTTTSVVEKISLLRKVLNKYHRKLILRNVPNKLRSRIKAFP